MLGSRRLWVIALLALAHAADEAPEPRLDPVRVPKNTTLTYPTSKDSWREAYVKVASELGGRTGEFAKPAMLRHALDSPELCDRGRRCEWIAWVDADAWFHPHRVVTATSPLHHHGITSSRQNGLTASSSRPHGLTSAQPHGLVITASRSRHHGLMGSSSRPHGLVITASRHHVSMASRPCHHVITA